MRCFEKSVVKRKVSITIKKLYLIFLKYKQTQPACAKNAIDYTQNSFSDSWNQASQIYARSFRLSFLLLYNNIYTLATIFTITQEHGLFHIRNTPGISYYDFHVLWFSNLTSIIEQFNISRIFLLVQPYSITT